MVPLKERVGAITPSTVEDHCSNSSRIPNPPTFPPKLNIYRTILIFVSLVLFFLASFLANATLFTNSPWVKAPLLKIVQNQIGREIQFETMDLDLFPNPRMELSGLVLEQRNIDQISFQANQIDVELLWLPLLLKGSVVIKRGLIEQPEIILRKKVMEGSKGSESWVLPEIRQLDVSDGRFTILNESNANQSTNLSWNNIQIDMTGGEEGFPVDIRFSGKGAQTDPASTVSFTGILDHYHDSRNFSFKTKRGEYPPLQLNGQVEVTNLNLPQIIKFLDLGLPGNEPQVGANFQADISIIPFGEDYTLAFGNFQTSLDKLVFRGKAHITGLAGQHPAIFITGSSNPIPIETVASLYSESWLPNEIKTFLSDHKVGGTLELLSATVAGSIAKEGQLSALGRAQIQEGTYFPGLRHSPVRNITATLIAELDSVKILDFSGEYESSRFFGKEASIEFRETGPWITLQSQAEIAATDIAGALMREAQSKDVVVRFLDVDKVKGVAHLSVKVEGPLTDPTKIKILVGDLVAQNIAFNPLQYPLPIEAVSGRIAFNEEEAVIHILSGLLGSSPMKVLGKISFGTNGEFNNLTLQTKFKAPDLKALFPDLFRASENFNGPMDVTLGLSGPMNEPTIHGRIDLTSLEVSYQNFFQKPSNIPAWLEVKGKVSQDNHLIIHKATLEIPPFRLGLEGEVDFKEPQRITMALHTGSGPNTLLPRGMVVGVNNFQIHNIEVNIDIDGQGSDWTAWQTSGLIKLTGREAIAGQKQNGMPPNVTILLSQRDHTATTEIQAEGIPAELVIPKGNSDVPRLTGTLSVNAAFESQGRYFRLLEPSLMGEAKFQINNGLILHSVVISKILGLLNLPILLIGKINLLEEGFPFDQFTGTISVKDGILNSNDFLLNSPLFKLTAAGNYDIAKDQLDVMTAVSPFGAYSNLLKSIPLFGKILKGERKGLTTALFEVKGSVNNPEVKYLPLESLTQGLTGFAQLSVDIMTNSFNPSIEGKGRSK